MHVMPLPHLHAATTATPVSRQHLDYLCLCAGADLGEGLLDLEASLHHVSLRLFRRIQCATCSPNRRFWEHRYTGQRTCFLIFMTLKRSKSFSPRLFCIAARFLAHALSSNFCWTLCSSHFFATWPTPLARGSLGMTMGVKDSLASATSWRGMGAFSEGPSMRTYVSVSR